MLAAHPLPGLPPYGPPARSFPIADAFREGFVIEFTADNGERWVGNFANGWVNGQRSIHTELGAGAVIVVADGAGYMMDANERRIVRELGIDIQHIWFITKLRAFVVTNGLWLEAFDAQRLHWRSRRFSWDGVRHCGCLDMAITGEAFDPTSDKWLPFNVDLSSGTVEGGSYTGPAM